MRVDDYFDANEYEYDHNAEYDENIDEYSYSDEDTDDHDNTYTRDLYACPTEVWSQLRIDEVTIGVSTRGRVKLMGSLFAAATEGEPYLGTPYRVYMVNNKRYYVHDLVWRAFRGLVNTGYEVRHHSHYVQRRPHVRYSNRLECLTCERITVSPLPLPFMLE
jgi:hypothetical protein